MIYLLQVKIILNSWSRLLRFPCACVCVNEFRHVRLSRVSDLEFHELELTRNPVSLALKSLGLHHREKCRFPGKKIGWIYLITSPHDDRHVMAAQVCRQPGHFAMTVFDFLSEKVRTQW